MKWEKKEKNNAIHQNNRQWLLSNMHPIYPFVKCETERIKNEQNAHMNLMERHYTSVNFMAGLGMFSMIPIDFGHGMVFFG